MRENAALAKWRRGEASIGGWLLLGNTHTAEVMANAGFDWLVVDMQHGLIDYRDLTHMLPAISTTATTPLVRVSGNNPAEIMKALDAGAMGVIVPMVSTREQALTAISACRYPPDGTRSFGPVRAALYGGPGYATEANSQIACIIMIETEEGLENLEAIVSAPSLGGVFVGPADLALALGTPLSMDSDDPRHVAAVQKILTTCKRFGVPAGIYSGGPDSARRRLAAGFNFVTLGADATFMMQALTADLAAVRTPAMAKSAGGAGSGPYGGKSGGA
jgi:4-hydroxy-2-oxoheptanedioate aldolase